MLTILIISSYNTSYKVLDIFSFLLFSTNYPETLRSPGTIFSGTFFLRHLRNEIGCAIILNCNITIESFYCLRRMPQMPSMNVWHVQILYVRMPPHFMRSVECEKHSTNKTIF